MLKKQVRTNAYTSISGHVPGITKGLRNSLATFTDTKYKEHVHYITTYTNTNTNDTSICREHHEKIKWPIIV